MEDNQIGWLAAILVGAIAGWAAEKIMKSDQGLFLNIVLGIIGAMIANAIFGMVGISFGGILGYLVAGIIGACILIGLGRFIRGKRA